jgi:diadenosine tetraphosphate (Ap4A) HIT family hydrolase
MGVLEPSSKVRRRRIWSLVTVPRLAAAEGPAECFVCDVVGGARRDTHHIIHEDDTSIAFLAKWPPLWGTALVCPKAHREDATSDFTAAEYLDLQRQIWRIGNVISASVPCERLYVLSLGSARGNRHVHWHLAPLPPGVPRLMQQCRSYEELLMGRLDIPDAEYSKLAEHLRRSLTA